ncbi:unnamed protein product [Arabidopsis halleri]
MDMAKAKGVVFNYEVGVSSLNTQAASFPGYGLMECAAKISQERSWLLDPGTSFMVNDPSTSLALSQPFQHNSTVFGSGLFEAGSSGIVQKQTKARKRPSKNNRKSKPFIPNLEIGKRSDLVVVEKKDKTKRKADEGSTSTAKVSKLSFQEVCRKSLSNWKKKNDMNALGKIHRCEAALEVLQSKVWPNVRQTRILKKELAMAYREEEQFWQQKSREKWMRKDDEEGIRAPYRRNYFFDVSLKVCSLIDLRLRDWDPDILRDLFVPGDIDIIKKIKPVVSLSDFYIREDVLEWNEAQVVEAGEELNGDNGGGVEVEISVAKGNLGWRPPSREWLKCNIGFFWAKRSRLAGGAWRVIIRGYKAFLMVREFYPLLDWVKSFGYRSCCWS